MGDGVASTCADSRSDEDAGQHGAAEQRQDTEREEAEDRNGSEAGPPLRGLLPLLVGIAVVLLVVGGIIEVVDVLRLRGIGDRHVRRRRAPVRRRRRGGDRRCGRASPLVAIAGHVAGGNPGSSRRGSLVEVIVMCRLAGVGASCLGIDRIRLEALVPARDRPPRLPRDGTDRRRNVGRGCDPAARRDPSRAGGCGRPKGSPSRTGCRRRRVAWSGGTSGSGSRPAWGSPCPAHCARDGRCVHAPVGRLRSVVHASNQRGRHELLRQDDAGP